MRKEKDMTRFSLKNIPKIHLQNILTLIRSWMHPEMYLKNLKIITYFYVVTKKHITYIKKNFLK